MNFESSLSRTLNTKRGHRSKEFSSELSQVNLPMYKTSIVFDRVEKEDVALELPPLDIKAALPGIVDYDD